MLARSPKTHVAEIYSVLTRAWGRPHWWPADSRFEVIVGAYLTQNTSWTNVELAMKQLRAARILTVAGIRDTPLRQLEKLIRSSGYFRQKARRLKTFVKFLDRNYGGSLTRMFRRPASELRPELLALDGVGPETADSILLYAGQHPVFVVDAYTKRIAARHGILPEDAGYEEFRSLFEAGLASVDASAHTSEFLHRGRASAFAHEPDSAPPAGAGIQRYARAAGGCGQGLLLEIRSAMRTVPAAPSLARGWGRSRLIIDLRQCIPDR